MAASSDSELQIKNWLQSALQKKLSDISIDILGNSKKGDGYLGDIVFVNVTGTTPAGSKENLSLVLKCSKKSKALRETLPVQQIFLNELYIYETVFPTFAQFQEEHGAKDPFTSVPKFYGKFVTDHEEIIVLENLKAHGYDLWDRTKPLTRKHIEMVIREYGKLHAISAAMQEQQPEKLKEFDERLGDFFAQFTKKCNMQKSIEYNVENIYEILKGYLPEGILSEWFKFKDQIGYVLNHMWNEYNGFKVVIHGDCWNNNYLFQAKDTLLEVPTNVAILDWQISKVDCPIWDLSYFLFCTISREDIKDIDAILEIYYESFSNTVKALGSDSAKIYPHDQFIKDWIKYSRNGLLLFVLVARVALKEYEENIPDMAESVEAGSDFMDDINVEIKDKAAFRERTGYVVEYVVQNNLIK